MTIVIIIAAIAAVLMAAEFIFVGEPNDDNEYLH